MSWDKKNKKASEEQGNPEAEILKGVILEKEKQIDEDKQKLLRTLADLDNYKKRMAQEREEIVKLSNETLILAMLPVLDGMERAFKATKNNKENEEIIKGLALIKKQFEDALMKFGVQTVDATGKPYDPHFMEAIMQQESDGPEHIVLEETQKGYLLYNKLIRPAMVIVSKKKGEK
ncbi:MAG: nucleotide exchange factor GrpE [Candidatus Saganbacteria bacterium]|nr:nucleotide exchange factor GrpE [Candidatus Saganbacteria bacterium]